MSATADQLLRVIDERVRLVTPDTRMGLDWLRGQVVSVSAAQKQATVRFDGAGTPTSGIVLTPGVGVVPAPGDEVVVLRRRDGSYLMIADLTALLSTAADVTTLPTVVFRASGGDDAPALRALLADIAQGTTILLPDPLYLLGSEVVVNRSNIAILARGIGGAQYGQTLLQRVTNAGGAVLRWAAASPPPYPSGFPLVGGRLEDVRLDGNGLAEYALHFQTVHRVHVRRVQGAGATAHQLYLRPHPYTTAYVNTNVISQCTFKDCDFSATGAANGIYVDGDLAFAHVAYFNTFDRVQASAENGRGIYLGPSDSNLFLEPTINLVTGGSGNSVEVSAVSLANRFIGGWAQGPIVVKATGNQYGELLWLGVSRIDHTTQPGGDRGAALAYIDDLGRASGIIPDPRSFAILVDEEFGDASASGKASILGGTINYGATVQDHPGVSNIQTGATINTVAGLGWRSAGSSGIVLPSEAWEMWCIFKLLQTTDCKVRIGLLDHAGETADPPTHGIYLEYISGTDTTWKLVTRSSGTETRSDTGVTVGTGWVKALLRRRTPADVGVAIGNMQNQADTATFTNVPTALLLTPAVLIKNTAAADKGLDVDRVLVAIRGLDR